MVNAIRDENVALEITCCVLCRLPVLLLAGLYYIHTKQFVTLDESYIVGNSVTFCHSVY